MRTRLYSRPQFAGESMSVLETLAGHVAAARSADLAQSDREILRRHVIDTAGALVTGLHTPEGRALAKFFHDDPVARRTAVTRLTEIDDIHLTSSTTPGSIVVPTALTVTLAQSSPKAADFADAVSVAYEAMTRYGLAIEGPKILYRGIWPTCFTAPFGAAAAACRAAGLDAGPTGHALAMAAAEATPGPGRPGPPLPSRWLVMAAGAASGARSADAAVQGFTGDLNLLDGTWLKGAHGIEGKPAALADGLRNGAVLARLSLKPFCSAKQAVGAVAGLQAILGRGVAVGAIKSVRVFVPDAYRGMISTRAEAGNRTTSIVSAAYQLGLAAHDADGLYDVGRDTIASSGPVAEFAARVTIAADDSLAAHYPARWPARIEVELDSGSASEEVLDAPGDPGRRLDGEAVHDKFRRIVGRAVAEPEADALYAAASKAIEDDGALADLGGRIAALEKRAAG